MVEPEGRISAQKCCDIVVRHIAVSPAAVQQTDKFRIHIFEEGCPEVAGKRDVLATLHPGSYREAQERHAGNYVVVMRERACGCDESICVIMLLCWKLLRNYVVEMNTFVGSIKLWRCYKGLCSAVWTLSGLSHVVLIYFADTVVVEIMFL